MTPAHQLSGIFPMMCWKHFSRVKEGKSSKKGGTYHHTKATSEGLNTSSCIVFGESKKSLLYYRPRNLSKEVLEDNFQSLKSQP
jgi:hypothetical protein